MRCKQIKDGEWVQPRRRNYYFQCCDCKLIHSMDFRLIKDKLGRATIQFRAKRLSRRIKDRKD